VVSDDRLLDGSAVSGSGAMSPAPFRRSGKEAQFQGKIDMRYTMA
jgi:hypothetical protein